MSRVVIVPRVTIKTDMAPPDGHAEEITEYLCDWPDCPNVATHVLGRVREIGICSAVCDEHATAKSALSRNYPKSS